MLRRCWLKHTGLLLALCTGFFLNAAFGQSSIEGRVVESASDTAIEGAGISLARPTGAEIQSARTGPSGEFRFPAVEPGDYQLRVEAGGHAAIVYHLALRPRQPLILTIEMTPRLTGATQVEVRATASGVDTGETGSLRSLSRAELAELPAPMTHSLQTLVQQEAPGAVLSHDNFVHVRGNEMSLHQFINGVSFLDNPHEQFSPPMSPEVIEFVSILTGGFPAEYGNRFGGVLDIATRSGRTMSGHGSASLGVGTVLNRDAALEYGGSAGRWGYYLFASGAESGRFLNPPEAHEIHDLGYGLFSLAQIDYQSDKDFWKILVMGSGSRFQLPNTTEEAALGRDATRRLASQTAILTWQRIFSPRSLSTLSVYQRVGSDRLVPTSDAVTPFGKGSRSPLTTGFKSDFSFAFGGHTIKTGADAAWMRLLESFTFDPRDEHEEGGAGGAAEADAHGHGELEAFDFRGRNHGGLVGVYLQDHFSPFRNLTVDLGARFDQITLVGTYQEVSPRVGLAYYFPGTRTHFHFNYNRFFTPPPVEYLILAGELGRTIKLDGAAPGITKPYTQNYFEAGWKQELHRKILLEANAYRHRGRNSFENSEISNTRLFMPTNFARANAEGVEVALNLRDLETAGFSGRIQYAAAWVNFFGPVSGGFPSEDLHPNQIIRPAFDQTHTGTASLFYRRKWRDVRTALNLRYGSGTPVEEEAPDGGLRFATLPQHLTVDLSAGLDLWKSEPRRLALEFDALNVSNSVYRISKESETTPIQFAPRRTVLGRLAFHF
ncbi:MAG: TonB-dependent receptor [Acidobacteria bacterium]|nr:TonB-dependent receptor [Acidobacteriota bacterium]